MWNCLINLVTVCFYCFLLFGHLWGCPLLFWNLAMHSQSHFPYFPKDAGHFRNAPIFSHALTFQFLALVQVPPTATSL